MVRKIKWAPLVHLLSRADLAKDRWIDCEPTTPFATTLLTAMSPPPPPSYALE
jgi:hypothetical protein